MFRKKNKKVIQDSEVKRLLDDYFEKKQIKEFVPVKETKKEDNLTKEEKIEKEQKDIIENYETIGSIIREPNEIKKESTETKKKKIKIKDEIIKDDEEITSSVEDDVREEIISNEKDEKSELNKIVEFIFNEKYKRRKTRLRARSVAKLSIIDTLAQIYDVKFLKLWQDAYCELITSTEGKGIQTVVDITKYSIDRQTQRDKDMMEMMGRR